MGEYKCLKCDGVWTTDNMAPTCGPCYNQATKFLRKELDHASNLLIDSRKNGLSKVKELTATKTRLILADRLADACNKTINAKGGWSMDSIVDATEAYDAKRDSVEG